MLHFGITAIGVIPVSLFLLVTSMVPVHSVEVTFLVDTTNYLRCRGNVKSIETYIWTDITLTPSTRMFIVGDKVEKMEEARKIGKYENFDILNYYPVASTLEMTSVSLEDRGTYTCGLLPTSETIETFVVEVEAEPLFIDISCHSIDDCKSPPSSPSPSNIKCTCKALGVYPDTLTFIGNGDSENKLVIPSSSGPFGSFDISTDFRVSPDGPKDSFWCSLIGYTGDVNIQRTTATYTFQPPDCELQLVTENETCTTASLNCMCHNAIPDVNLFSFYDDKKELIGDPVIDPVKEVEMRKELSTFYCRGCNGVNYALYSSRNGRLVSDYAECSFKQRTELIVGLPIGLGAIVIVILVIAWRYCKKKGVQKNSTDESGNQDMAHQYQTDTSMPFF